jgi:hypothetical protein
MIALVFGGGADSLVMAATHAACSYGGLGDFFLLLQNATASLPQRSARKYVVVGGDEMARLARLARDL